MTHPLTHARSLLFVPANRLDRLAKALDSGADAVIVDLEDAVPPDAKNGAREALAACLQGLEVGQQQRLVVRVNAVGTPWHAHDLALLSGGSGLSAKPATGWASVMLPKSEDPADLRRVAAHLAAGTNTDARLIALVESLAGLDQADALARESGVLRLAFGHLDFQLDLGMRCSPEEPELAFARNALVAASRRARLPAPIDGVTTATGNTHRLAADAARARAFGFGGKLCIHPAQVEGVNQAFSPSAHELAWAHRVMEGARSHGGQAFRLDGRMVDLPVIRAAEATLGAQTP